MPNEHFVMIGDVVTAFMCKSCVGHECSSCNLIFDSKALIHLMKELKQLLCAMENLQT